MAVFWNVAPCTLVEVCRRFREISLIMGAAINSDTSANLNLTKL
jgi:hypothetical protein